MDAHMLRHLRPTLPPVRPGNPQENHHPTPEPKARHPAPAVLIPHARSQNQIPPLRHAPPASAHAPHRAHRRLPLFLRRI